MRRSPAASTTRAADHDNLSALLGCDATTREGLLLRALDECPDSWSSPTGNAPLDPRGGSALAPPTRHDPPSEWRADGANCVRHTRNWGYDALVRLSWPVGQPRS